LNQVASISMALAQHFEKILIEEKSGSHVEGQILWIGSHLNLHVYRRFVWKRVGPPHRHAPRT
jgi:hypothetical protein